MSFNSDFKSQTLSERLKTRTLFNHQQVEKLLMVKMRGITDTSGYVNLLSLFYGYFGALEISISRFIEKNLLPDFELRRKAASLKNDIAYFNGILPQLATGNDLPEISSNLEAFGVLYVLEGSTLGGAVISRIMQKQLQMEGTNGFSFFRGYGNNTETMWNNFKNALENLETTDEQDEIVINSANRTFLLFGDWIEKVTYC